MSWAAVIAGGAALIGGIVSSQGAKSAASTQASGANAAAQVQQNEFNTITQQEQPFMQGGYGALNQLDYLMGIGPQGGYNATPGMYNSAGPAGTGNASIPYGTGAKPNGGTGTVYGVNGTTPNFGLQQGGTAPPTATGGQGMPTTTPRMMAAQKFSLGDLLNPFSGGGSNPLNPINLLTPPGLPNIYSFNGAGGANAISSATGGKGGGSSTTPAAGTVSPLQYGYGGAPGSYQPSQSTAGGYGSLLSPFTIDMFHNMSPAYQFQQQQGMQGTLNGEAGGAGALSGAAQKDLMGFNQNLANTAFNNAFNQYQTQQGNVYNRLLGMTQLGQNAAANTGQQGTTLAGNTGTAYSNAAAANAAGIVGQTNAISGAISSSLPWLISAAQGN